MSQEESRLSTTALARKLEIPAQQLFVTLRDYGWIDRAGESWVLTAKGEFEGGQYQQSKRYGRYIVWPGHLEQHPLLVALESNLRINAAGMCRYYPRLHARQINRALAELGLQRHSILGWELTERGRTLGGLQEESRSSGAFYVSWPHEIIDNPVIHRELSIQSDQGQSLAGAGTAGEGEAGEKAVEPDLFADSVGHRPPPVGIDGHHLQSALETRVCDWLYLAQLAHACQRALPTEELLRADFYVPEGSVYIDCWEEGVPASALAAKLRKREVYHSLKLRNIEINAADAERLDEVLGRGLLAFGIRC